MRAEARTAQGSRAGDDGDHLEALELELLLTAVARRYGYDFRNYSPASLRRRLRKAAQDEGVGSFSGLQDRVLHDVDALRRLLRTLSVQVTGMFRDPEFFRALRASVLPVLRTYPFVRVWHAGCSTGEEVYSLAILLHEEGILERCRIYATDLSEHLLERAQRGVFPLQAMREHTAAYHRAGGTADFSAYYTADAHNAILRDELRRRILFSQHNLVSDGPFNEFQLVLCRNVMIYFDAELRDRVLGLLTESLVPYGILALGMRESLAFTPHASRYQAIDEAVRIYRRVR